MKVTRLFSRDSVTYKQAEPPRVLLDILGRGFYIQKVKRVSIWYKEYDSFFLRKDQKWTSYIDKTVTDQYFWTTEQEAKDFLASLPLLAL